MEEKITIAHGSGGRATKELLNEVVLPALGVNKTDSELDAAPIPLPASEDGTSPAGAGSVVNARLAFTTDGFVVQPLEFAGGNIGKLAACGTINDLAVSGAKPLSLTCSLIIEEGFSVAKLHQYLEDLRREVETVGASVIAGDTKVVRQGEADGLYITTSGVGLICQDWQLSPRVLDEGDVIMVSGTLGDHGATVLTSRDSWPVKGQFRSDCKALWPLVEHLHPLAPGIRFMRDPTRGGLAAVLHEVAEAADRRLNIKESALPAKEDVRSFCEILGLDFLHLAGEGCLVLVAAAGSAKEVLARLKSHSDGCDAVAIGEVGASGKPGVVIESLFGGSRTLESPLGEQLPRIC